MPLTLVLHPPDAPVVADGPIRLHLELRNTGTTDVAVPERDGPSPFRYSIYSPDGLQLRQTASQAERDFAEPRLGEPFEFPPELFALPEGLSATYEDDVMSLLTQALPPGAYQVEASYRSPDGETCTSGRVPLAVVVSQPEAIVQELTDPDGRIVIVEWHRKTDGGIRLRKRETGLPPLGRFFDLLDFEHAQPLRQCAISLPAAAGLMNHRRWLAWIDGGDLLAGFATDRLWKYPTRRIPTGLENSTLWPVGYTLAGLVGAFVVSGTADGQPSVRLVHIQPGDDAGHEIVDVALDKRPDATPGATCTWYLDRPPELVLNWRVEFSGATTLVMARVNLMTGELMAPLTSIFTTLRPVAAVAFPAVVGPDSAGTAQILLAPGPGEPEFTHLSFELRNPSSMASRQIPALEDLPLDRPHRWVLPSAPAANASIVAATASDIWASDTRGWRSVARGDIEASSVRLWAFSPRSQLCTWFDRAVGYQSRQLAAGSGQAP